MKAVTTCAKCPRATRPLPTDWSALDFFDKPVAAQDAVFRVGCTAVVDAEKPCLRPAPAAPRTSEAETDMGGLVRMDERRQAVCMDAAIEVEAIARALPGLVPNGGEGVHGQHYAVRAMAGRVLRLASVLMSGLSDESVSTAHLERVVNLDCGQG